MKRFISCLLILLGALNIGVAAESPPAPPHHLQVEGKAEPIGVDRPKPAFSWKLQEGQRGAAQVAYQILAATSPDRLTESEADSWNSGKIASDQSHLVPYGGVRLASNQRVYWKVRIWNQDDEDSEFSEPASFQTGLFAPDDWSAQWIRAENIHPVDNELTDLWMRMSSIPHKRDDVNAHTRKLLETLEPAPLFRREFDLPQAPVRATLYTSLLGYGESRINGEKVGDGFFEPALTHYPERSLYNSHDVTDMLRKGANALGFMLGDGWYYEPLAWASFGKNLEPMVYGRPVGIAQLHLEFADGSERVIATGKDGWKSHPGPILQNHYFIGECYDARALPKGWDSPDFDDSAWGGVEVLEQPPTKQLQSQQIETEKVIRRVKPVAVSNPAEGIWVYDMGELLMGFPEIKVPAGHKQPLAIRFAEWVIDPAYPTINESASALSYDGGADFSDTAGMLAVKPRGMGFFGRNFRAPDGKVALRRWHLASPTLVYQGTGEAATWHPRFAVFPYRYVEVQGFDEQPPDDFLTGLVVHTAMERTGSFTSSEPLFEDILEACLHSTLYNTHGMTWDNPCERAQQPMMHSENFVAGAMNYDFEASSKKLMEDFRYLRGSRDEKTLFIPYTQRGVASQAMVKSNGAKQESPDVTLPWKIYQHYGDRRSLEEHFPYIEKFFNHFYGPKNPYRDNPWLRGGGYVGHLSSYMTSRGEPVPILDGEAYHSTYLYELALIAAEIARIIDKPDRAAYYDELAENIQREYRKQFPTTEIKGYGSLKLGNQIDDSLGSMIGNAHAVASGIVPPEDQEAVAANLARIMRERYDNHPVSEAQSISRILKVLSDHGEVDLAAEWMKRTEHPSYGYMLSFGHGTIWEGFANVEEKAPNSIVQHEFQTGGNWFQESLCGVRPDPANPGMKHFFLEPKIPQSLEQAGTEFTTPYGVAESSWSQSDGRLSWKVRIPPNSSATLVFPGDAPIATIKESGASLSDKVPGVHRISEATRSVRLDAGHYLFEIRL